MEISLDIPSVAALSQAAAQVLATGKKKILLYGEMGAGKTTFVRAFCAYLGSIDEANSPTFAIVNEYRYPLQPHLMIYNINQNHTNTTPKPPNYGLIHHIDLYRLKNLQEALDIGIEDYLYDTHYCLIEWGQLIAPLLEGEDFLTVAIVALDEQRRTIRIIS